MRQIAVLDPWSPALYQNQFWNPASPLNRDNCMAPWQALGRALNERGIETATIDMLRDDPEIEWLYFSLGQRDRLPILRSMANVRLVAYWQLEPPVVDPQAYSRLATLVGQFESVYTHDPSLAPGAHKLYWPQVHDGLFPDVEGHPRKRLCFINGNKFGQETRFGGRELYSERRRALEYFGDRIDLYGPGWNHWPNWKGQVPDKFEVLKQYDFAIIYENQEMAGYVTEKPFEAMMAGCIPIYLGAPDIADFIWGECFIDLRQADGYGDLDRHLKTWNDSALAFARGAARGYFASDDFAARFSTDALIGRTLGLLEAQSMM